MAFMNQLIPGRCFFLTRQVGSGPDPCTLVKFGVPTDLGLISENPKPILGKLSMKTRVSWSYPRLYVYYI